MLVAPLLEKSSHYLWCDLPVRSGQRLCPWAPLFEDLWAFHIRCPCHLALAGMQSVPQARVSCPSLRMSLFVLKDNQQVSIPYFVSFIWFFLRQKDTHIELAVFLSMSIPVAWCPAEEA